MNKKSWEGVCKKVALLSVVSLLLNVSMIGMSFSVPEAEGAPIENEEVCEAAVDVVLIMDRSGSMGWEIPTRLSQAKNAANVFLGNLGADDQSAVVSYASEAALDKELSNNHSATQTTVNNLMAKGGTNIGDAIYLSNQELGSTRTNPQAVKVAILLTDGRATCPHYDSLKYGMCGFVEDDEDIAYTLAAAQVAADLGYKVFTIGLGQEYKINEEMLQEVAEITGAEYYYAPSSGDLEGIYESIRWQLCEYGSISGCKYDDLDNDGDDEDFITEDPITDWEIILTGETNGPITQLTNENGCYKFSGLLPGAYTVSEGGKDGITDFVQTYPQDPSLSYSITLGNEESLTGYDFGNYFPICGNNILDEDFGESCDDGNNEDEDGCSSECLLEDDSVCGNGILEENEECDGSAGVGDHQTCVNCELVDLTYCGDGRQQTPNDEELGGPLNDGNEECDEEDGVGANQTCSANCVLLESLCRVKLDTVIVLDRSGSMGWEIPTRLSQAKIAANSFVGKLGSDDRSALVSFSTTADSDKPFSNNHTTTQTMVSNLMASGATNIGDAIGLANDEFSSSADDVLKIEILLTDGRANQPNGNGFDENPLDVAYAEEMAVAAALEGIKIFTIGLGNDINEVMLQNIANDTGAQYYNAPTADELEEIFSEIAYNICQYGSISGCKYETDNQGNNDSTISGWEINLSGDANLMKLTDENGCYTFAGLLDGSYVISEGGKDGVGSFVQTYPQEPLFYSIALNDQEEATGYDFGNYFPVCGNGILDEDFGEECDDGNIVDGDNCSSSCNIESSGGGGDDPVCGDGVMEGTEECDGTAGVGEHQVCLDCVLVDLTYCGDGIEQTPNDEGMGGPLDDGNEECDDGNADDNDSCNSDCEIITGGNDPVAPMAGEVIINEIMYDSAVVTDANGEWFEVYNTTANDLELEGCVISDLGSDSHTIGESLVIPANEYAVFARSEELLTNGGLVPAYVYGFTLGNTADEIILTCGVVEIDRVEYDEENNWPVGVGVSIILNDPANDNNNSVNWCLSTSFYYTNENGDLGTPGNQNDSCEGGDSVCGNGILEEGEECDDGNDTNDDDCSNECVVNTTEPVCGDGVKEGAEECDDGNTEDDDGCSANCKTESEDGIGAGDVIINELMWMGSWASPTGDEWIELRNTNISKSIDLSGCQLTKLNSEGVEELMLVIPDGGLIDADGFYLISNYDEAGSNISAIPDLVDTAVNLSNTKLQIKLYCGGEEWNNTNSVLIDTAGGGGAPLEGDNGDDSVDPIVSKKSMSRRYVYGDGTSASNWYTALTAVGWDAGATELGTPGSANSM